MKHIIAVAIAFAVGGPASVAAQEPAGLAGVIERRIDAHREAQATLDAWAAEKAQLEARRETAAAHAAWLEKRRAFEAEQVKALTAALDGLGRQLAQFNESIERHRDLPDTLAAVVLRLDAFVSADLPFHTAVRRARVAAARATVEADSTAAADKLRAVFDALDAEAQYAGTVEVYRADIAVGGVSVTADIVRVGRVALLWRSADGTRAGEYDRGAGAWVELPSSSARDIARAIEMGAGTRDSEIVLLPLGKVQR